MKREMLQLLTAMCLVACLTALASAAPVNLAPSGTASADSEGFGSVDDDGNDGNRDGNFANGSVWHTNDFVGTHFYTVDLGSEFHLDRVQVFPRTGAGPYWENFEIEVKDASNVVVFSQAYNPNQAKADPNNGQSDVNTPWATNDLRNVVGQTVTISTNGTPLNTSHAEFEIYGQSSTIGANIALNKSVTSSGAAFGSAVGDGNDGVIDGDYYNEANPGDANGFPVYHSPSAAVGQFWQVDLGYNARVDYVNLFDRTDGATTGVARVTILEDDGSTVVATTDIDLNAAELGANRYDALFDPAGSVVGRYVKVETVNANFLAFAELEVIAAVNAPGTMLHLADMVGGGDGTGTGANAGIEVYTGNPTSTHRPSAPVSTVNVFSASPNTFVDGVFVPDGGPGGTNIIPVSSTGLTVTGVSDTDAKSWDEIWNGHNTGVSSGLTGNYSSILGVHASKGITFDLQAINDANPGLYAGLFTADAVVANAGTVDFYVFVDGVLASLNTVTGTDNLASISVNLDASDRFLTLIVSSSGGDAGDWSYFGDAKLTLIPAPAALPAGLLMMMTFAARRRGALRSDRSRSASRAA